MRYAFFGFKFESLVFWFQVVLDDMMRETK